MTTEETIKSLTSIRRKLMRRMLQENKYQNSLIHKYGDNLFSESYGKSVGIHIGCSISESEIYKLIKKLKEN